MTTTLTIPQYAKLKNKDRTCVFKAVKKNKLHLLPDVVSIKNVGRFCILEVTLFQPSLASGS